MFLLSLFARTRAYSTKELAHKNAAMFLHKNIIANFTRCEGNAILNLFQAAYQREQYQACCAIWNDLVRMNMNGESFKMVKVEETETDQPFT